ncbi:hypothetical protein [Bordetella petrii]|uniref:hypothetical protein n=1 Tax=Bordetella petrii TaxID=94624 RepID=UPI001E54AE56|nr:hypothetical protein [Bordetella petrii]MCD0502865.1 hypothetical protein [Bordetella petrii]
MSKLGIWVDYDLKIVCNELRRQNLITLEDWVHEASHCAKTFSTVTYQGYCLWAIPCLRLMRRYPLLAKALAHPVRWMAADIKHQNGAGGQRHWLGWCVRRGVFWPGNWLLGQYALRSRRHAARLSPVARQVR